MLIEDQSINLFRSTCIAIDSFSLSFSSVNFITSELILGSEFFSLDDADDDSREDVVKCVPNLVSFDLNKEYVHWAQQIFRIFPSALILCHHECFSNYIRLFQLQGMYDSKENFVSLARLLLDPSHVSSNWKGEHRATAQQILSPFSYNRFVWPNWNVHFIQWNFKTVINNLINIFWLRRWITPRKRRFNRSSEIWATCPEQGHSTLTSTIFTKTTRKIKGFSEGNFKNYSPSDKISARCCCSWGKILRLVQNASETR